MADDMGERLAPESIDNTAQAIQHVRQCVSNSFPPFENFSRFDTATQNIRQSILDLLITRGGTIHGTLLNGDRLAIYLIDGETVHAERTVPGEIRGELTEKPIKTIDFIAGKLPEIEDVLSTSPIKTITQSEDGTVKINSPNKNSDSSELMPVAIDLRNLGMNMLVALQNQHTSSLDY